MEFLPDISKWVQILLRWGHVFFAILWVGTSFTFNYLDNKLPKNLWDHIVNKEDYKDIIHPVIHKMEKKFEYLSFSEIQELNDIDKEKYYFEEEKQIHINPLLMEINHEMIDNDKRIYMIENTISGSYSDDDY